MPANRRRSKRASAPRAEADRPLALRTRTERAVRDKIVGFKVNADEYALIARVAQERGFASVSDLLRAAFNAFAGLEE